MNEEYVKFKDLYTIVKLVILAVIVAGLGSLLLMAYKVHTTLSSTGLAIFFILIWLSFKYFKTGRESVK